MKKWLARWLCLALGAIAHAATPVDEIEGLLAYVKQLDGAVFVRNGGEHTPSAAEAHLRMKWDRQRDAIKTAEDFIARCATKSSTSGERYRIRLKDGATRDAADLLRERLTEIRRAAAR